MCLDIIRPDLCFYWQWGDGHGGFIHKAIDELAIEEGFETEAEFYSSRDRAPQKKKIRSTLRTAVFERDAYRCRSCNGHKDLSCDHIHPESQGGETTLENLQTLCRSCNSRKGAKVPA